MRPFAREINLNLNGRQERVIERRMLFILGPVFQWTVVLESVEIVRRVCCMLATPGTDRDNSPYDYHSVALH